MNRSLENQLTSARIALYNARDDETILGSLAPYGYDEARMEEGIQHYQAALTRFHAQQQAYGRQYAATDALWVTQKRADKLLHRQRTLVQLALEGNRQAITDLQLHRQHPRTLAAWLTSAEQFYKLLLNNSEYLEALVRFNLTREALQQGQALVQAVVDAQLYREQ